jgi:hypothetical protein
MTLSRARALSLSCGGVAVVVVELGWYLQLLTCQYLYLCSSKASKLST